MKTIGKIMVFAIILVLIGSTLAAFPQVTQINYDPNPAVPGTTITFLVQLENLDSTTQKDITVSIEDTYPFTVKTDESNPNPKFVGNIQSYGKTLVQFNIYIDPTAENQTYNIPIIVEGKGLESKKKTYHPIIISGKEPIVKIIDVTEEKLLPGEEKEITFTLQNVGTSTAHQVVLEMIEDRTITATGGIIEREITPLGAAAIKVGSINPGEEKTTKLKISVSNNATIKNYTMPIKVSFNNQSGERTETTSYVGLKVFGNSDLDATIKENNNGEIIFELYNKGMGKADFTLVELTSNQATIEKPKQFIGTLNANDVDTIKTKINYTQDNALITMKITYLDSDAKQKTKEITLQTQAKTTTQEGPNWILILIILALIGFGAWKYIIKKKK
ncbi:MAG: hypothetical protein PHF68_01625 [Candidatus ainarchaeum sp.]|nr:hypothetical protein [Candidatus ainarchaeum sp.]